MASTISYDAFTCFTLFSFGLLFVAALWTRGNGRSPTGVVESGVDRLPPRPDRIADRVLGRPETVSPVPASPETLTPQPNLLDRLLELLGV